MNAIRHELSKGFKILDVILPPAEPDSSSAKKNSKSLMMMQSGNTSASDEIIDVELDFLAHPSAGNGLNIGYFFILNMQK